MDSGIVDYNGHSAEEILEKAKTLYRAAYKKNHGIDFTDGKTYPSDTWFKYVEDRRPIILVYLMDINVSEDESNQKKQVDEFRKAMNGIPALGLAMGLPRNDEAALKTGTKYKANKIYNWFEQESILAEGDEVE